MHELMAERAHLLMVKQSIVNDDEPQRITVQSTQPATQAAFLHAHVHRLRLHQKPVITVYRPSPPFISISLFGSLLAATS